MLSSPYCQSIKEVRVNTRLYTLAYGVGGGLKWRIDASRILLVPPLGLGLKLSGNVLVLNVLCHLLLYQGQNGRVIPYYHVGRVQISEDKLLSFLLVQIKDELLHGSIAGNEHAKLPGHLCRRQGRHLLIALWPTPRTRGY